MALQGLADNFPRYKGFDPAVPVYCVTPKGGGVIHRFFDTSPISPSGRFLALTRFPFEDKTPRPGDEAWVVLVDIVTGAEKTIATTRGWDTQLGAQVQWGATDEELFFNDMDTAAWQPFGVLFNPLTGNSRHLGGTVYHVSANGRQILSPCLQRAVRTQLGYGVMVPPRKVPRHSGAPENDGITLTNVDSGKSELLISIREIVERLGLLKDDRYTDGDFYGFHTRWNPQGDRIMYVLRWGPPTAHRWFRKQKPVAKSAMRKFVLTMDPDGQDLQIAVSDDQWARGGHHPTWAPDGRSITMNLNVDGKGIKFVQVGYDGKGLTLLHPELPGSGHPSLHPGGRFLISDAYPKEKVAFGDGTVPLRLIDLDKGKETTAVRIGSEPTYVGSRREMRVDLHPVWDQSGQYVTFNACPDGTRRVYIADLGNLINV